MTLLFPIHSSVGMAVFLHKSILVIDLSCHGRTYICWIASNLVVVCRIDDFGRVVNQGFSAPIRILGVECTPLFRVRVADNSVAHSLLSVGFLTYFPLFILASAGFGSSSGMPHTVPMRMAPGTRPSAHKICMRRVEIPHRSAVCVIDKYFMGHSYLTRFCLQ